VLQNGNHPVVAGSELAWMRDTDDANWAEAYEDDVIARSLRLSLAGDETALFLDPLRLRAD
jgi:hypothetical protein